MSGDDAYKNSRIKLVTSIIDGGWLVRRAVGRPVQAYIGKTIPCSWKQSGDMLECTCDVASSFAMRMILRVAKLFCKQMICDLAFFIECRDEDELPERMLGGVRIVHHDITKYKWIQQHREA